MEYEPKTIAEFILRVIMFHTLLFYVTVLNYLELMLV